MNLDFQKLEQVLAEAAAKHDPAERAAYLDQACGEDRFVSEPSPSGNEFYRLHEQ